MYKLLFFIILFFVLSGCGAPEPEPEKNSLAGLKARLSNANEERFNRDGSHAKSVKKNQTHSKRIDDSTAYVYKGHVLSPKEEKPWIKAGISNKDYPKWKKIKVQANEVKEWEKLPISYATITVFKKIKYNPSQAQDFLNKTFFTRPIFYTQFGTPVYEFDSICKSVIDRQSPPFAYLEEKCLPYMKASHKNETIGHLLDVSKQKKGPLPLQYLAELRRLVEENTQIQSGMEVTLEEFIDDADTDNFVFLFPLLKTEPTQAEMDFIDEHKLALQEDERFYSFQNPEYWIHKAEATAAAKLVAARQEALLRVKKDADRKKAQLALAKAQAAAKAKSQKEEAYKRQQFAHKMERVRRKKAKEICGDYITQDQFSGREVLFEGMVLFTVGEAGKKMFGYGVRGRDDSQIYFIRDPKNIAQVSIDDTVSWRLKTMGRTEALSKKSREVFVYNKKSKTKFTMALYLKECKVK